VNGQEGAGSVRVPDQMEQARTRELQEELRRRGADRTRPQPELDYIDRLLKSF
jgi:8-oxo-dGTP pyrophosphatase MutT (NUDIX family)